MTVTRDDQGWPPLPDGTPCCMGSAVYGPGSCSCWTPVLPQRQDPRQPSQPTTRCTRCHDCAFRPDSPERADGTIDQLIARLDPEQPFYCHQGLTPITEYQHPSGARYTPAELPSATDVEMDYQPASNSDGVPCKDNGTPLDVCAGWASEAHRRHRGDR